MFKQQWAGRALLIGMFLLLAPAANSADPVNTGLFNNIAIKGYDPVAYFTEKQAVKGKKGFEAEWEGAKWRFSSAKNRTLFLSAPEKYTPQFGGYCAYAVAHKKLAGIDPRQFSIVDGKLYLNYNQKIQQDWLLERDKFIDAANANWPMVLE